MTGPFFSRTDPADAQDRLAASHEQAAAAFASELSTETDPVRREYLGKSIQKSRAQAVFCREQADRMRRQADADEAG